MSLNRRLLHVRFVLGLSFALSAIVFPARSQTLDENIQLMEDKLNGYDRRFRPVLDQSKPIVVNVTFDLIALKDFDEVKEKFSVIGLMHLSWVDEKLTWDPVDYGGAVSQLYSIDDIWYPILVLVNPSKGIKDVAQSWMTARVYANGFVLFYPGAIFDATCSIDVTYYPFDTQTCELAFVPWGIGVEEMILHSASNKVLQSYFSENGEWTFVELTATDMLRSRFNKVTFTFKMKRKPTFLLVNVILPIVFMAVISVFVFVLPPESGERISFSITVLLALAVFFTLISDNLPKTSSPLSHLSYFLTIILVYSVVMCIVAICNLCLYFKDENNPVPNFLAWTVNNVHCRTCKTATSRTSAIKKRRNRVAIVEVAEKPAVMETDETPEVMSQSPPVTWKDVSSTFDVICIIVFSLAIVITCSVYLYILTTNA